MCSFVCLFVYVHINFKFNEQIFLEYFMLGQRKKRLNFGKDKDHILDSKTSRIFKSLIFNLFSMTLAT